ncbi:hypothetical protein BS47DRAFT_1392922 [Hydnum rufescens UP504]|uniref:Uncharacterized protein n=1 Tax=Hydnum rufescens UP504 TaxID=1448309 RepID=A0A9P6AXL3_9AGAM|nr:hypothetical protein BS47DRAFT_1392922 [Hydnum rufescens UP504]
MLNPWFDLYCEGVVFSIAREAVTAAWIQDCVSNFSVPCAKYLITPLIPVSIVLLIRFISSLGLLYYGPSVMKQSAFGALSLRSSTIAYGILVADRPFLRTY